MILWGHSPKRSLGQNFLVSDVAIARILEAVRALNLERWTEIGPGLGALTDGLRDSVRHLRLIELDSALAERWRAEGLDVTQADALKIDWARFIDQPEGLVSNLPYQIAARLVMELSPLPLPVPAMVLMFQKEVAQRILAGPRSEHYGLLSVVSQLFWSPTLLMELGPRDFYPAPRVASRVVLWRRKEGPPEGARVVSWLKMAFAQRRKKLAKNLLAEKGMSRDRVEDALRSMNLSPSTRAEELSPDILLALYRRLHQ
jgi:16S rRNA (adenine1518-N6/adenine1519-N6)-dimethyltransferase